MCLSETNSEEDSDQDTWNLDEWPLLAGDEPDPQAEPRGGEPVTPIAEEPRPLAQEPWPDDGNEVELDEYDVPLIDEDDEDILHHRRRNFQWAWNVVEILKKCVLFFRPLALSFRGGLHNHLADSTWERLDAGPNRDTGAEGVEPAFPIAEALRSWVSEPRLGDEIKIKLDEEEVHRIEGDGDEAFLHHRLQDFRWAWSPLEIFKKGILLDSPWARECPRHLFDAVAESAWARMGAVNQSYYWDALFQLRQHFDGLEQKW